MGNLVRIVECVNIPFAGTRVVVRGMRLALDRNEKTRHELAKA
jgi:hypothetical protein